MENGGLRWIYYTIFFIKYKIIYFEPLEKPLQITASVIPAKAGPESGAPVSTEFRHFDPGFHELIFFEYNLNS